MTSDESPAEASDRGVGTVGIHGHTLPLTSSPGGHRSGRVMADGGQTERTLRGAILAAEVAVDERRLKRTEAALLKALGQTRKLRALEEADS